MKEPLKDNQTFIDNKGRIQKVIGEVAEVGTESVCYTMRGDWFRRQDRQEVTGAFRDKNNNPLTIQECYRLKNGR